MHRTSSGNGIAPLVAWGRMTPRKESDMRGDALDEVDEQGDEIARLRRENESLREALRRLADQDATLSVQGGNVIVTMDATLTDEERDAIEQACDEGRWYPADYHHIHTLRGLLKRTAV